MTEVQAPGVVKRIALSLADNWHLTAFIAAYIIAKRGLKAMRRNIRICHTIVIILIYLTGTGARGDTWRGTAPVCKGRCLSGETQLGISNHGDGAPCFRGLKVLCSNHATLCKSTMTKATCLGVVMICENGSSDPLSGVFHSCNAFACGACFFSGGGTQTLSPQSLPGGGSAIPERLVNDTCKTGYVWRDGIKDDHICVTPKARDQAAADSTLAAGRRVPGSNNCKQGFVWRAIVPSDLVCVTVETRAATASDSAQS